MAGTRLATLLAFVAGLLLMAPVAWRLTSVERADLPLAAIWALKDAQWWRRPWPAVVALRLPSGAAAPGAAEWLQGELGLPQVSVRAAGGEEGADLVLHVACSAPGGAQGDEIAPHIDDGRGVWVSSAAPCSQLAGSQALRRSVALVREALQEGEPEQRQQLAYHLSFRLLNADPESRRVSWDFEGAYAELLEPLVERLGRLTALSVDSAEILYARLTPHERSDPHFFTETDLSHVAGANDFSTAAVAAPARAPTLQFWLYVPEAEAVPLQLRTDAGKETNAFTVPDWGGVVIHNSPSPSPLPSPNSSSSSLRLGREELAPVLEAFGGQLRTLLGVSPVGTSGPLSISDWELERVARAAVRQHSQSCVRTLLALAQLVEQMPFMRVKPSIAEAAAEALGELQAVREARDVWAALAAARRAEDKAERGYLDPTMVPQMYFPDEHLYAVYVPLWAPLALPLLVGLVKEVKRYRAKRSRPAEAEAPETPETPQDPQDPQGEHEKLDGRRIQAPFLAFRPPKTNG